ncbi:MAG: VanZ family protein [Thermosynechococcaceae cyanobacterium]
MVFKFLFGLLLAIATHQSLSPRPLEVFQHSPDKFLHVLCWGVLSAALYLAFRYTGRYRTLLICLFIYSVILEIAQLWVPGRFLDAGDVVSNAVGCLLIYGVTKLMEWRWPHLKIGQP